MPPALKVRASGANGTRPPAEQLRPVLPNAAENPVYQLFLLCGTVKVSAVI